MGTVFWLVLGVAVALCGVCAWLVRRLRFCTSALKGSIHVHREMERVIDTQEASLGMFRGVMLTDILRRRGLVPTRRRRSRKRARAMARRLS